MEDPPVIIEDPSSMAKTENKIQQEKTMDNLLLPENQQEKPIDNCNRKVSATDKHIPARQDVDLSYIRSMASETTPVDRSVTQTGTRTRAKAMLKPKIIPPKCCSGFSGFENPQIFEQVKSNTRRVKVGFADTVGRRPTMEDQIVIYGGDKYDIIGVFDGHNGAHTSKFISDHLVDVTLATWAIYELIVSQYITYHQIYGEIFKRLNELIKENAVLGGSTGLMVTITENEVFIANAGDCRCVIGKGNNFRRVTTDHKPDDEKERARIESHGGEVIIKVTEGHTIARVNGILGVARAFGDFELEQYITCEPDVFRIELEEFCSNILVVACDGLWDVVSDGTVIKIVSDWLDEHNDDLEGASKKLRDLAFSSGSTDNISVVVVKK